MKTILRIKNLLMVCFMSAAMALTVNFSLYSQQQNDKDIDDDEDLFDASTDYKDMYKDLSNDGEWIDLTKSELTEQTSADDGTGSGISNKNEADGMRIVHVWRPWGYYSGWTPYSNGRWIYTDCNWYWHSYYSWGWGPYHYGRWVYSYLYGWVWIPGRNWAPSWVDWCYTDSYVGWYPRYPRFYRTFNYHRYYERHYDHWVFVDRNKMLDPKINKNLIHSSETNKDIISNSKINTQTNKYLNGKIVSAGPPVKDIEKTMGKKIDTKKINFTEAKDNSKIVKKDLYAYKPGGETISKNKNSDNNSLKTDKTKNKSTERVSTKTDKKKDVTSVKNNDTGKKDKITKNDNGSKKNNNVTKTRNENNVSVNNYTNKTDTRKKNNAFNNTGKKSSNTVII
ncbi:MAG: hypothetical protein LWX07_12275 [Bacteroidetes bacterium]|nr:hypothetical protein [Bacteroidota bacterium]